MGASWITVSETTEKTAQLEFDAETHTYRLDGEILPSVTQVLKAARLIDYSMIPQDVLRVAAARGTAVHQTLANIDDGLLSADEVPPNIQGYIDAARRFYQEAGFEPQLVEFRNHHARWRYAGTLDRVGLMAGSETIVDFKTGLVLPGHALQLAGYLAMLSQPRKYRRIALKLNDDGTYRVHEYAAADLGRDIDIFLSALNCWRWNEAHGNRDRAAMGRYL
jgi:hypothetical protein